MFSALKRLVVNQNENKSCSDDVFNNANGKSFSRSRVQPMGYQLQKEFSRGVQYNMKIIIKGDRNVGKSCLFKRLQGLPFIEEYQPTEEIQVANIHWSYKATNDIVKVEIWDVVDKGKKWPQINGLKIDNKPRQRNEEKENNGENQLALDAEFIDVYKAANGVIMLLDITKSWTFDYVQREIVKVPINIPVLILANHRDMGHHRAVSEDQVKIFIESLERDNGPGQVRYAESSMRNGFGLKFLHKFFNLPFLQLQRETLLKQLETNEKEIETTYDELNILQDSEEQYYDKFLERITNRRRTLAEKVSQTNTPPNKPTRSASMPLDFAKNKIPNSPTIQEVVKPKPSIVIGATKPFPAKVNLHQVQHSQSSKEENEIETYEDKIRFRSFLTESTPDDSKSVSKYDDKLSKLQEEEEEKEESEEEKTTNPKVLGYQEELDPEDNLVLNDDFAAVNESEAFDNGLASTEDFANVSKTSNSNTFPKSLSSTCDLNSIDKFSPNIEIDHSSQIKLDQLNYEKELFKTEFKMAAEKKNMNSTSASCKESKNKNKKSKEKSKKKKKKEEKARTKVEPGEENEDRRKFEEFLQDSYNVILTRELADYEAL